MHILVLGQYFWVVVTVQFFDAFALTINYRIKAKSTQVGIYPTGVYSVLGVVCAENLRRELPFLVGLIDDVGLLDYATERADNCTFVLLGNKAVGPVAIDALFPLLIKLFLYDLTILLLLVAQLGLTLFFRVLLNLI